MRARGGTKLIVAVVAATTALAGCSGSSGGNKDNNKAGKPVEGGTVTVGLGAQGGPNYIFPIMGAQFFTSENAGYFQNLMFRPLYWFGKDGQPVLNADLSLADEPTYSNGNKTVTIHLRDYNWSDGTPVTTRDVTFWENLLEANKTSFAAYTPGTYPDNIAKTTVVDDKTLKFDLTKPVSTHWFTYNQLSQITPMPQHAWDKTSVDGKVGDYDETPAGAKQVFKFLDSRSKKLADYAKDPLWQVVDGPWHLTEFDTNGNATMEPNKNYSGPNKPHIDTFIQKPFTDTAAEFNALLSGQGPEIGFISPVQFNSQNRLNQLGYERSDAYSFAISYDFINFNNPTFGPVFKQLYFRQALQMLYNQEGYIKNYYSGAGYENCGPVPTKPDNPFVTDLEKSCPYGYNPEKAKQLLTAHGWKVVPGGVSTCENPGTGADQCGEGVAQGQKAQFTELYPTGGIAFPKVQQQFKADAAQAGIDITIKGQDYNTISGEVLPCKPSEKACSWQFAAVGGWIFSPDIYPTGETLFATDAGYNPGSYSDPKADELIKASYEPGDDAATMKAYVDYMTEQIPVLWTDNSFAIQEVKNNLEGVTPWNPLGAINPEDWYFTK